MQQVCVQLPTSAVIVALPAFAVERRAAIDLIVERTAANPQQRRAAGE